MIYTLIEKHPIFYTKMYYIMIPDVRYMYLVSPTKAKTNTFNFYFRNRPLLHKVFSMHSILFENIQILKYPEKNK